MKRNHYTFGIGTIGRDMVYTMISVFLNFYLTDVLELKTSTLWWIIGIILVCRIFDALNDPIMGLIVDNTHSRFGKFKPYIAIGAFLSGIITVLIFTDFKLSEPYYIITFGLLYLCWGISFTINDISYWSMLPSLSIEQREREKIGSFARICASIGLFFVVSGILPLTNKLAEKTGSLQKAFFYYAVLIVLIMWVGQLVTLFGVKEPHIITEPMTHTPLSKLFKTIVKNDQLFYIAISMALFLVGYMTTTTFGTYYFKYIYGDEAMYSIFAVILGLSQVTAMFVFPIICKKVTRNRLFTFSIILVVIGYFMFFFAPTTTMVVIGIAGVLIFVGEAFIQMMMLMFLADSVEYGQWKLCKRNESITFSLQPFINKMGGALSSGIVSAIVIISGIKAANCKAEVPAYGVTLLKIFMFFFPLVCILISFLIYKKKFKIDETFYDQIINDLKARGEVKCDADNGKSNQ